MSSPEQREDEDLVRRYPGLRRLSSKKGKRRIPHIQQTAALDCGAANLAMVLAFHGRHVRLEELRQDIGLSRGGADAQSILKAARQHGLRGRAIRIQELESLSLVDRPSILHWEFNHWVIFDRIGKGGVHIVDPALGRRFVPMDQFSRSFTGVALSFEPTDDFEQAKQEKKRIWSYMRRILTDSGLFGRILVSSLLIQIFGLILPFITGMIVDSVLPRGDRHLLFVIGAAAGVLVLFQFISTFLRAHLLLAFQVKLDTRMTLGFLEHMVDLPYAFFQQRSAGDLMMRLGSNERIREILMAGALTGLLDGVSVLVYLALLLFTSPTLGFLVIGLGAIHILMFLFSRRRIRELMAQSLSESATSQSYQVELLSGIETLKAGGAEHRAVSRWANLYVNVLNINLARGRLDAVLKSMGGALNLASPLVILVVGGLLVLSGSLSLGMMLALSAIAMGFLTPLASLIGTAFQFQTLGSYIDRIDDIFDTPREQDNKELATAERLRGDIDLEHVSFRYSPSEPVVIKDVSVEIKRGQFVALVGASGSGKTTMAKLLLGLYLPTSGRVMFDGADLTSLELRSVRRQLGSVPQNPYVFGLSVRDNIAMSDPTLPLSQVVAAAKLAHIHDEIMKMPLGYDTLLADDGASISGGQRQRLVIARALLRKPAILLLDEATSALDSVTEKKIQDELDRLRCTRVVIAHRLSTVVNADLILVMDAGKIVEQGTHDELTALNGLYSRLVAAQMKSDDSWRNKTGFLDLARIDG